MLRAGIRACGVGRASAVSPDFRRKSVWQPDHVGALRKPSILVFLSLFLAMSAFFPGNVLGEEVFLTGIVSAFAAFVLLVVAALRGDAPKAREIVVLDGSNVMHWRGKRRDLDTVRLVAAAGQRVVSLGWVFLGSGVPVPLWPARPGIHCPARMCYTGRRLHDRGA